MTHRRNCICGIMLLALPTPVFAALDDLISRDWITNGDGLITFDRNSGLEWLDITVTAGNSLIGTEAQSYFDANGNNGGFRWATSGEILELFFNLSWNTRPFYSGVDLPPLGALGEPIANETQTFVALIGATTPPIDESPYWYATGGYSRSSPSSYQAEMFPLSAVSLSYSTEGTPVLADAFNKFDVDGYLISESVENPLWGSWLVRAADVSTVPLPGALFLSLPVWATILAFRRRPICK